MTDIVDFVTATSTSGEPTAPVPGQSHDEMEDNAPSIIEAVDPAEINPHVNTEVEEAKVKEGRRLKRKQSLEAQVTTGCGGGRKKQRIVDAFYSTLWPLLEEAGWNMVKGEGEDEGAVYFLPPGASLVDKDKAKSGDKASVEKTEEVVQDNSAAAENEKESVLDATTENEWKCTKCGHLNSEERARCKVCLGWRGGSRLPKAYFTKVRDVIERVLKSSDESEAKAADAYKAMVPGIYDQFFPVAKRASTPPPQGRRMGTRQKQVAEIDWKHERKHYPKASSRVGDNYQVTDMPVVCTSFHANDQSDLYDQVWDWEKATKSGKVEFVNNRVTPNKKVEAHEMLYQRGFVIPGFYQDVCAIPTTNGSNWTEDDKKRFKTSIFKELKNIRRVSTAIGKPMKECMTYYYGTFKKSKDYPRLKLAIYRHKQKASSGSSGDTWICDTCGDGGKLIACDSCELHYHLTCLIPPLQEVPEGTWICNRCTTKTNEHAAETASKDDSNVSNHLDTMDVVLLTEAKSVSGDPSATAVDKESDQKVSSNTDQGTEKLMISDPMEVELIAQKQVGTDLDVSIHKCNTATGDPSNDATNDDLDMLRSVDLNVPDMTIEGNSCLNGQSKQEERQYEDKDNLERSSYDDDVYSGGDADSANEEANLDASSSSVVEDANQNVEGSNSLLSQDSLDALRLSTDFVQQNATEPAVTVQSSGSGHANKDSNISNAALNRMKEIFKSEHHSRDASKFPTLEELSELRRIYCLTTKQITEQFRRMRTAENNNKKTYLEMR